MAIKYRKLWKKLIDMDMNKTDLQKKVGLSSSTIAKLSQNKVVQTDVLDRICVSLDCDIGEIMEIVRDSSGAQESDSTSITAPNRYSVVSLFSGCGGLDLGFQGGFTFLGTEYPRNPYEIVWANEINKAACATYRANVDERIIEGPIEELFDTMPAVADVVIGGFPCQDISINGKMVGVDGKRSGLYIWMVKAVDTTTPTCCA